MRPIRRKGRICKRELVARRRVTAFPTSLTPDRGFTLPLPLSARLLVEAALAELGVQAGPLNLPLEAAQGSVEAFVLLNENFQETGLQTNLGNRTKKIGMTARDYNAQRLQSPSGRIRTTRLRPIWPRCRCLEPMRPAG